MGNAEATSLRTATHAEECERVIAQNVKLYLVSRNIPQMALAEKLGIKASSLSMKMTGRSAWSIADLVNAADFLGVTPQDLMDDSVVRSADAKYGVPVAEKPGALVGAGSPRFLVSPFNPDAPVEGGISGAAKGALAGFAQSGVPSGSGSSSMPSKHEGIGVPGRSQAHETLGTMTTIIMRTSEGDMRMMLLLWDATPGNRSLKIVEIPVKTAPRALNNPDFPEK